MKNYFLTLGKSCNLRCIYCMQGENKPILNFDDMPDAKDVAKYFPEDGRYNLRLYGGEPLLYWDFIQKFIYHFRERNSKAVVGIITNGTKLTVERAKILNEFKVGVGLSHDGKFYEKTRRVKDLLLHTPDPYLTLDQRNISAVVSKINYSFYDVWDYFDDFAIKHGLPSKENVHIDIMRYGGAGTEDLLIYNMPEFDKMLDRVFDNLYLNIMSEKYDSYEFRQYVPTLESMLSRLKTDRINSYCNGERNTVDLDIYGNLYYCHNLSEPFGNVKDLGLLTGEDVINVGLNSDKCKACDIYKFCGGGCFIIPQREEFCYVRKAEIYRMLNILHLLEGGYNGRNTLF